MENDTLTSGLKGHRTNATVVFTDCVGFSARMSDDEEQTLKLLNRDHKRMRRLCEQFEGQVLKSTGDGLLMRFARAAKAVEFAIAVQKTLAAKAVDRPPQDSLKHRIGIHHAEIFITEADADVLGNGVNIAARLQAEAEPGGICISQTVYDKAKAELQFYTRYLGARELKNIREAVPAYKVLLHPDDDAADPLTETARALEQSKHALRIKKLLFYVCRSHWENHPDRLDEVNLSNLIQELTQLAPDLERLRHCLEVAVATLSKPTEYLIVATNITREMVRLYSPHSQPSAPDNPATRLIVPEPSIAPGTTPPDDHRPLYHQIAAELERADNSTRIHKLLFYVCKNRWEGNPVQLSHIPLHELIAELHQLAPTSDRLHQLVNGFVQTLSKQAEYSLVANTLTEKLQPLYQTHRVGSPDLVDLHDSDRADSDDLIPEKQEQHYKSVSELLEQNPNALRIKKLMLYLCRRHWESDVGALNEIDMHQLVQEVYLLAPTIGQLEVALESVVSTLNKQAEYSVVAQAIVSSLKPLYPDEPPVEAALHSPPFAAPDPILHLPTPLPDAGVDAAQQQSSTSPLKGAPKSFTNPTVVAQLNDARQEILRSISSMRAKVLIFSAFQSDDGPDNQDWLSLKRYDLDELLQHLVNTCSTYVELEMLLRCTAKRLGDAEENMQTANTISQCLRPVYQYLEQAQPQSHSTPEVKPNLSRNVQVNLVSISDAAIDSQQSLLSSPEFKRSPPILDASGQRTPKP